MKKDIRNESLNIRNNLSQEQLKELSLIIQNKLFGLDNYIKSKCIFVYLNFRSEVITDEIIEHAVASNKRVFIPICINETRQIVAAEINSLSQLTKNNYGIREASLDSIKIVDRKLIDIAIVPGAAFDKYGNRLGYGAGYYDRFFNTASSIFKVALAYSFQVVNQLAPEPHDISMDTIVTEKEIIRCITLP
jgi:5-formyltetrahydrofolate cyclo-ligase